MGLLFRLWAQVRAWETSVKLALVLAAVLLAALWAAAAQASGPARDLLLFALGLLVLVTQALFLWGSRHLVTPYTQAQRLAAAGDFAGARDVLVAHLAALAQQGKSAPAQVLTLLGNAQRSLGELAESEAILRQAVALRPMDYFPLYGLGRTLLVQGRFDESLTFIQKSLAQGAPPGVQCEIGLICHWLGDAAAASAACQQVIESRSQDVPRTLMAHALRHQLGQQPSPDAVLLMAGLPFWEAEVQRYAHTPYGQALQPLVRTMRSLQTRSDADGNFDR